MPQSAIVHRLNHAFRPGIGSMLPAWVTISLLLLSGGPAWGQLRPACACALWKRPISATLVAPDAPATGPSSIELIDPAADEILQTEPAKPGDVDLAELFPRLWTTDSPRVLIAQVLSGKERVGPALVLVPMISPRYAPKVDRDGAPILNPAPKARVLSGYWIYSDQRAVISTSKGDLVFALRPDAAPNSVENFRSLISKKFYDGIAIHRIVSLSGRAIPDILQFGDPTGTGQGSPGYFIDFEPSPLKHAFGTLSFARTSEPNSAGSQVIVTLGRDAAAQLDGKYTVFGRLVSGAEALIALARSPVDADGKPRDPITIDSAKLVDAPPYGTGPKPETDPMEKPTSR